MIAKTDASAPMINLVFKGRRIVLSGIEHSTKEYWFTKNEDGYNKLPKGESATIVAIGLDGKNILFGTKEIIIGEREIENVKMKTASVNEIKTYLAKLESL